MKSQSSLVSAQTTIQLAQFLVLDIKYDRTDSEMSQCIQQEIITRGINEEGLDSTYNRVVKKTEQLIKRRQHNANHLPRIVERSL